MNLFPNRASVRAFNEKAREWRGFVAKRVNRKTLRQAIPTAWRATKKAARVAAAPAAATVLGTIGHELTHAVTAKAFGASMQTITIPGYLGGHLLSHWFPRFFYTPETAHAMHGSYTAVTHLQSAAISAAPNVLSATLAGWMMSAALKSGKRRPGPTMLGLTFNKGKLARNRKLRQEIYAAAAHIDAHSLGIALPHAAGPTAYVAMHQYQQTSQPGKMRPGLFAAGVTMMWHTVTYGIPNAPGGDFNNTGAHVMAWLNQKLPAIGYHAGWEHVAGAATVFGSAYALYKLPAYTAVMFKRIGQAVRQRRQNAYAENGAEPITHFENVVQNGEQQQQFSLMDRLRRRKK